MGKRIIAIVVGTFLAGLGLILASAVRADPPAAPGQPTPAEIQHQQVLAEQAKLLAELKSDDPQQVQQAVDVIRQKMARGVVDGPVHELDVVMEAKRFDLVDALAVERSLKTAEDTIMLSGLQKARSTALLSANKPEQALAAAKQYYNVCPLRDSADAIDQVALCLVLARPQEKGLAKRFRLQQTLHAQAATMPATQADLGEPVLPTIKIDGKPYEDVINGITINSAGSMRAKANLLLLADRGAEAQTLMEQAYDVAKPKDLQQATEDVARAIRAATGWIGPANDFILSKRGGQ